MKNPMMRRLAGSWMLVVMCLTIFQSAAFAAGILDLEATSGLKRGQAEYYNANPDQRLLVQVNFVSGVSSPGIYHLPDNTNLLEAISLAGGLTNDGDLSEVYVKRPTKDGFKTIRYDLSEIVRDPDEKFPTVGNRDTVMVEVSRSRENLTSTLSLTAMILGIVTSGAVAYSLIKK